MTENTDKADKKFLFGWVMYDFANSAYTTLVVTFIYGTYFVSAIAPDKIVGTALWSRGVTLTAICVAILSPILGALADQGGLRKKFLFISTRGTIGRISGIGWGVGYIGGLFAMFIAMIGFVSPEVPWFGFSKELGANIRATNLLVACWFALFSIPLFLFGKSPVPAARRGAGEIVKNGLLWYIYSVII
jgi:UMF1 family MFS transporter